MNEHEDRMQALTHTTTLAETNLILQALGNMPFVQVADLIVKIQQQARAQIDTAKTEESPTS